MAKAKTSSAASRNGDASSRKRVGDTSGGKSLPQKAKAAYATMNARATAKGNEEAIKSPSMIDKKVARDKRAFDDRKGTGKKK